MPEFKIESEFRMTGDQPEAVDKLVGRLEGAVAQTLADADPAVAGRVRGALVGALREAMEDPACDAARLRATYAQFAFVNGALSRWRAVFERHILPLARPRATLPDVGCGGGRVAPRPAVYERSFERWHEYYSRVVEAVYFRMWG